MASGLFARWKRARASVEADRLRQQKASGLTWQCEVCKSWRRDEEIDVLQVVIPAGPTKITRNVKYCFGRSDCLAGAIELGEQFRKDWSG